MAIQLPLAHLIPFSIWNSSASLWQQLIALLPFLVYQRSSWCYLKICRWCRSTHQSTSSISLSWCSHRSFSPRYWNTCFHRSSKSISGHVLQDPHRPSDHLKTNLIQMISIRYPLSRSLQITLSHQMKTKLGSFCSCLLRFYKSLHLNHLPLINST